MKNNDKQRGFSLILVITVIAVTSAILLTEINRRSADNRDRRLNFSIAQTEYILNSAYAYLSTHREWPVRSRDCLVPPVFENDGGDLVNGWGEAITGGNRCDENSYRRDYSIVQIVPESFVDAFTGRFQETVEISGVSGRPDVRRVAIYLDRTGGARRNITFGRLGFLEDYPFRFDPPACFNAVGEPVAPIAVMGLDAACASRGDPEIDDLAYPADYEHKFSGFRTRMENGNDVFYDFFANVNNEDGTTTIRADWDAYSAAPFSFDGHYNADEDCLYSRVTAAVLSWCP